MKLPIRSAISLAFAFALSSQFASDVPSLAKGRWIDLTHSFSKETIYWPTAEGFVLSVEAKGMTPKGYFYSANHYAASEHGGTHLDAPVHFAEGHQSVDQIPLDHLTGPAVVVDVSKKTAANPDYQISVGDFTDWEKQHGKIPEHSIVLLNTGFAKKWPNAEAYLGTAGKGTNAVEKLHFPGLDPKAAEWLISARRLKAVGLDTASIDFGQSKLFETHRLLFQHEVPAFENVANLDQLPIRGSYVVALPMKIQEGSGAPLRIIALVGQK